MPPDPDSWFFPVACTGFGLFLVGGVNLLLPRRRVGVRVAASLAACGLAVAAAVAAAAALDAPGAAAVTAQLLGAGLLACLLLGSRRVAARAAAVVGSVHRPAVRFGLLAAAGAGAVVGSVVVYERGQDQAANAFLDEMDEIHGLPDAAPSERARAVTDRGTAVVLKEPTAPRDAAAIAGPEQKVLRNGRLEEQVIRLGPADNRTNCHGWVFTGGGFIVGGNDVPVILRENGYEEVHDPQPGDLAVYRAAGAVTHTARVRYVTEGQPVLVEGKWGTLGVFLHPADRSPYGTDYAFYRSPRTGHLLAGLGAAPANNSQRPVFAGE